MKLIVSHAPHIRAKEDSASIMLYTILALMPAALAGVLFFGINAVVLIMASLFSAITAEYFMIFIRKRKVLTADVLSAAITGLLLAMVISPASNWWMVILGSVFAIVIAKHAFGGLGFNIFNPALAARAFLLASWPVVMTLWPRPFDAVTGATHLALARTHAIDMSLSSMASHIPTYWQLFSGNRGGSLGETCIAAILLGGLFLLYKGIIDWRIPSGYIISAATLSVAFGIDPIFSIMAGGLMFAAFFMATDPVTKPMGRASRWIFGIGCGIITMIIRVFGGYPEGVCYAILIMNAFTPLLDRYVVDRRYGYNR